jgi:DNA (cytosine-5)-methyltransferase 1
VILSPDVVVFFSGASGSSIGARMAGARVVAGVNHERDCVDVHDANFPDSLGICQDLHLYNHASLPLHVGLIASPVCRANSTASQPARAKAAALARLSGCSEAAALAKLASAHNAYGALPWAVMDALEVNRPEWFIIENVDDWSEWVFFKDFIRMAKRLGYKVSVQLLNSLAWGVPQERLRLFMIGTLGRKAIKVRDPKRAKPAAMHDCVDWDDGEWMDFDECGGPRMREQLSEAHYRLRGGPGFIQLVDGRPISPSSEPLRTMTRQDQYRWVKGGRFRYPKVREMFRLMGFPNDYVIPPHIESRRTIANAMAGDAVCPPVMRGIVERIRNAA